ncbi:hypothetical protein DFP72DRAFT_453316 [Ephemerocybe angulata]|uniref:Uncharacterized protein n=1 Tax=Ephemerocybe angulata TaxID=980116 RepID=A0A8H6M5S3_9AGAR|nr:hypothetical protein DFP72DRAFT_453316 [Tulosesus angulatus]
MFLSIPSSIYQAVSFITRPLSLVRSPAFMHSFQTALRTVFNTALEASPNKRLVLTFTSSNPPPIIAGVSSAVGIQWAEWIESSGQREFDLIIDSNSVIARYPATESGAAPQTVTIWKTPELNASKRSLLARLSRADVAQVPIRKFGQRAAGKPSPVSRPSPISLPSASLTPRSSSFAQQLRYADDESEEELFAMISKTSIISPTPTKERFIAAPISPISSPEPSESSRPSSRTSTYSTCFSDEGSLSSASSVSIESFDIPETCEASVYIDTSKRDKTKYLYQGGVSSTLTGGVMLGRPTQKPSAPAPAQQKYRAPAFTQQRYQAPAPAPAQQKYRAPAVRANAANASSWRRPAAPVRF